MRYIKTYEVWGSEEDAPEVENGVLIGVNYSWWSWDDDSDYVDAYLYFVNKYSFYLIVKKVHVKHGIGKGERSAIVHEGVVGNINKINTNDIAAILKKHGHEKSRGGGPFKKLWKDVLNKTERGLKDLLSYYIPEEIKKKRFARFDL